MSYLLRFYWGENKMSLTRDDILKILNEYEFDVQDYIVIGGAALVLQNVKEYTSDVDIATSDKLYNKLLKKHNCQFEKILMVMMFGLLIS